MTNHHVYIPISETLKFEKICVLELMKFSSSLKMLSLILDLLSLRDSGTSKYYVLPYVSHFPE